MSDAPLCVCGCGTELPKRKPCDVLAPSPCRCYPGRCVVTLDIEGVLAAHSSWDYGGPGVIECACSWRSERLGPEWNSRKDARHRAHVAAVLGEQIEQEVRLVTWPAPRPGHE